MRALRFLPVVLLLASTGSAHAWPAPPDATRVQWEALPCFVACAHWSDLGGTIPDRRDPSRAACEAPFPPGAYDDVITRPAPEAPPGKRMVLWASLDQLLNWDLFMCEAQPPHRLVAPGNGPGEEWCGPFGPNMLFALGCTEDMAASVEPGEQVILRAYNFDDVGPAKGLYWFTAVAA